MASAHKNLPLLLDDPTLPTQAAVSAGFSLRRQLRTYTALARQQLWHWSIEPSPKVAEPDQRRQAILLSGLLLSIIVLAIVIEIATDLLIDWGTYTGYRQTIIAVVALGVVYLISRTERVQLAAILAVIIATIAVFLSAWGEPRGVLGGLFDFLILPLWLGSLFIDLKKLTLLTVGILAGLLMFPLIAPAITLSEILVGPFIFTFTTSLLLLVITRHRNQLEHDRQAELSIKELRSRREAARAEALLRIADRLNAQLDQETVLAAVGEEISRALNTTVSVVSLYDQEQKQFHVAASVGLAPDLVANLPVVPKAIYDQATAALGKVFTLPDLQSIPNLAFLHPFKKTKLRSIAFASMIYEHELIGSLSAITNDEPRVFTRDELLLLQGLADQAALALVNTRLYKDARRRLEHLQALRAIEIEIATNRDLKGNLTVLLDKITEQLNVDAAAVLLLDERKQLLDLASCVGFYDPVSPFKPLALGEGIAGQAALQQKVIRIQDLRNDPRTIALTQSIGSEQFVSFYAAPLIAQGQIKGVLEIFHRSLLNPDEEWLNLLEALAHQAAIAIENATLFERLQSANGELTQAYDSTIEGWSHALDLRDKETEGHSQRVTTMTLQLAQAMGFSESDLVHVRRGALLHDIGKMGVPDGILLKPSALTADEWQIMCQHPQFAYNMLAPIDYLRPALDIPYCHHEKWDGTGYPQRLAGQQIPMAARIFAITDVYDALTSDRPYRKAWSKQQAIEHIRALSGTHFDPQVVNVFLQAMSEGIESA